MNPGRTSQGQAGSSSERCGGTASKRPWEQPSHLLQSVFVFHWTVLQSKELENNGFIIAQWPFVILDLLCHCLQPSSTEHLTSCPPKLVVKEVSGQLNGTRASSRPHEKRRGRVTQTLCHLLASSGGLKCLFPAGILQRGKNKTKPFPSEGGSAVLQAYKCSV